MLDALRQIPSDLGWLAGILASLGPIWWYIVALGVASILLLVLGFLLGLFTRRFSRMAPLIVAALIAGALSYGFYMKYARLAPEAAGEAEPEAAMAPPPAPPEEVVTSEEPGTVAPASVGRSVARSEDVLAVEDVLYGTNRKRGPNMADGRLTFGKALGTLQYGKLQVSIPKSHKYGKIERPIVIRIGPLTLYKESEDPARHFMMITNGALSIADFKAALASAHNKRALVYIHGYRTSFQDAAFTTAQIVYDTEFDGQAAFFSWPSAAETGAYLADYDKAIASEPVLAQFLRTVRAGVGPDGEIFLIAHSLGNLALLQVLYDAAQAAVPSPVADQVIFAAPDVGRDVFLSRIKALARNKEHMTLYASAGDKALLASTLLRENEPRAGLVVNGRPVIVTPGVDTIDASAVSMDFFDINHGAYDENRLLLGDIGQLIATGRRPPDKRSDVFHPVSDSDGRYWQIPY